MKKILCLIVSVCLSLAITGCGKKKEKTEFTKEETEINVTVENAVEKSIENTVTYTGELSAGESTSVSSKVSGPAITVYKEVGDYVNEGDILLKIDETDYKMQYDSALAAYNQAQAGYNSAQSAYNQSQAAYDGAVASYNSVVNGSAEQTKVQLESALNAAKIEYDTAKDNYDRQKVLFESGAISKTAFTGAETQYNAAKLKLETAQSNYDLTLDVVLEESATNAQAGVNSAEAAKNSASSQIESARAALESAQVAVTSAEKNLEKTTVKAPISGYIASRNANKGQMVTAGVEVFSIKYTKTIDAKINVTETIIPYVSVGTAASVKVKAANIDGIVGTVSAVSPTKNSSTGMYTVSVEIPNKDGKLKDGMFAEITLTIEESIDALVIPALSLLEDETGQKYVYIAEDGKAVRKNIEAGIITDEYIEAVSGISKGDKIIVSGKEYLSEENNKIRIVK